MSSAIDPELSDMGSNQSNTPLDPRRIFSGLIGLTYDTVGERAIESPLFHSQDAVSCVFFINNETHLVFLD